MRASGSTRLRISAAVLLCAGLMSCALFGGSHSRALRLVSVTVAGGAGEGARFAGDPWHHRPLIVLNLASERDLAGDAGRYELNFANEAFFCRDGRMDPARPLQNDPYLYDVQGRIIDGTAAAAPESPSPYQIYIAVRPASLAGQKTFDYDLNHAPDDVCVRLVGGAMLGGTVTSNTVVVPKAAIAAALGM
jgi:hypothetical protein